MITKTPASFSCRPSRLLVAMLLLSSCLGAAQPEEGAAPSSERDEMVALLRNAPLLDGHNDVPWQLRERFANQIEGFDFSDTRALDPPMHTDLVRLGRSGLGGVFWSVYTPVDTAGPGALRAVLEQIDVAQRLIQRYPETLELALSADDVRRIAKSGRIASLLGMEGGFGIESSLAALRQLHHAGVRYMTLTHSAATDWADSSTALPRWNGLTDFGREVVREMNRLGMLVDLSHVSAKTMHDALDVTEAPVIFSHSSVYALTPHPRNVPDDVLARLPANGGVVMVTFVPQFVNDATRRHSLRFEVESERLAASGRGEVEVSQGLRSWLADHPEPLATLADVADHIDALKQRVGIAHIGIGSDFDGIESVPTGLEDVSTFPELFLELRRRGYSDDELRQIAGVNVLRVLEQAERVAASLRKSRSASEALIRPEVATPGGPR
jgi:membrane dipeptidase